MIVDRFGYLEGCEGRVIMVELLLASSLIFLVFQHREMN